MGTMTNTLKRFHTGDKRKEDTVKQPEMVDLGLSVKWASFNLGAQSPEEYGDYFDWGETEGLSGDDMSRIFDDDNYKLNDYEELILDSEHDAATQILGKKWRIPTKEEFQELMDNTTITWETLNGIKGNKFTAENGNWIFLPVAGFKYYIIRSSVGKLGYYWSSSRDKSDPSYSCAFNIYNNKKFIISSHRYYGFNVRPVLEIS